MREGVLCGSIRVRQTSPRPVRRGGWEVSTQTVKSTMWPLTRKSPSKSPPQEKWSKRLLTPIRISTTLLTIGPSITLVQTSQKTVSSSTGPRVGQTIVTTVVPCQQVPESTLSPTLIKTSPSTWTLFIKSHTFGTPTGTTLPRVLSPPI